MHTAPGRILNNFHFLGRGEFLQKFAINGQLGQLMAFNIMQAIRQGHIAEFMVMAVGFSVGRDIDDLGIGITGAKTIRSAAGQIVRHY